MHENEALVRAEQNSTRLAPAAETASASVAAQVESQIRARYALAYQRPRDIDQVRVKLLRECARPRFAEAARYRKPVGQKSIEGPSVRFAEAALRCLGNVAVESSVVFDDSERRIIRVQVVDLEANLPLYQDIVVEKFVERRSLRPGQSAISSRTNSRGEVTYRVEASEDDLLTKQGALTSKALRNLVLRLVPADVLDEAMDRALETLNDAAAKDPDAERKRLADAFAAINVTPAQLRDYLGHELSQVSPAELVELRGVYQSVRDGETSWSEVAEQRRTERKASAVVDEVKGAPKSLDELAKKRPAKKAAAPASPPPGIRIKAEGHTDTCALTRGDACDCQDNEQPPEGA